MERQIDREIAADNKANCTTQTDTTQTTSIGEENEFDSDSEEEDGDDGAILMYGPQPQIVTNDLKSLDEMVSLSKYSLLFFDVAQQLTILNKNTTMVW